MKHKINNRNFTPKMMKKKGGKRIQQISQVQARVLPHTHPLNNEKQVKK